MKQLVTLNYNIPYVGGLCEGFVEGTAGQATLPFKDRNGNWTTTGVYPTATAAWNANVGNHPGEQPPGGVMVPVHFTLGNNSAGHVALALGDGRVASSTMPGYHNGPYIHKSLQDLIDVYARNNGGCTYLGWREYIGNVKAVEGGDMTIQSNEQTFLTWERAMKVARGQALTREDFNREFVGKSEWEMLNAVVFGPESDTQLDYATWGKMAKNDRWDKQIADLTADNQKKDEAIGKLKQNVTAKPSDDATALDKLEKIKAIIG